MSERTIDDLRQLQALPLEIKIKMTQRRIRDWYNHWEGDVHISFSGGKDSTVLKDLVEDICPDVPSMFVDTGLEYPEIRRFAMSQTNVDVVKPSMKFTEVIKKYGYPVISKEVSQQVDEARHNPKSRGFKKLFGLIKDKDGNPSMYNCDKYARLYGAPFLISQRCCDVMKKRPLHKYQRETGRKGIVGTMAEESILRLTTWVKQGCNAFDTNHPTSKPMSFWTEQDVLRYIKEKGLPYCKEIYGDIVEEGEDFGQMSLIQGRLKTTKARRTGCVFCMFGAHLEGHPNRFEMLKETHPNLYDYCMRGGHYDEDDMWVPDKDGLGMREVLDFIGVKY